MADKLLNKYKNKLSEVVIVPSSGGAFEISVNGQKIYSKLETGKFPDERALLNEMDAKI